jgi:DNA repair exonuclease SbcCD ATPase subunit
MSALAKLIAKLKALPGAEGILADLTDEITEATAEADAAKAAESKVKRLTREVETLKADSAAGTGNDALAKLQKERDEAIAARDSEIASHRTTKLRATIADKLGVTDPVKRKRAVNAFIEDYLGDAEFDDKGELAGIDKALKTFRESESFYFEAPERPNEGGRQGADPSPVRGSTRTKEPTADEKIDRWQKHFAGESKK